MHSITMATVIVMTEEEKRRGERVSDLSQKWTVQPKERYRVAKPGVMFAFFFFFPADPPTWLSANHCQGSRNSKQVLEMCKSENSHGLKRFIGSACGLPESAEIHELSSKAKTTWFHNSLSRTERHMRKNKSRETSNLFLSSDGSFFYGVPLCWLLPPA